MDQALTGRRILITSGPTRADIDAVRFICNRSTGRLGARIAAEALKRGSRVTLVAGFHSVLPEGLSDDDGQRLRVVHVETVQDLIDALEAELTGPEPPDTVVHAMAVLDYVPAERIEEKTPSGRDEWSVRLVRTPKVIKRIKDWAPGVCLVEFKLEVGRTEEELKEAALASLRANRADLVVANDLTGIRDETHPALILAPDGQVLARPATKTQIAQALCDVLGN